MDASNQVVIATVPLAAALTACGSTTPQPPVAMEAVIVPCIHWS